MISKKIWDTYADWSALSVTADTKELKRQINGNTEWLPNYIPQELDCLIEATVAAHREYGKEVSVLDFGCGLGRNGPVLRRMFPRVIGLDVPAMVSRLMMEAKASSAYDVIYDDLDRLVAKEDFNVLYDSVVFQHIADYEYVAELMSKLLSVPSFNIFISLKNHGPYATLAQKQLLADGWSLLFGLTERFSFQGAPHDLLVLRRPRT